MAHLCFIRYKLVEPQPNAPEGEAIYITQDIAPEWSEEFSLVIQFFSNVPLEVRDLVARFQTRQWQLLVFATEHRSAALELMSSNPALAFCLASRTSFAPGQPAGNVTAWGLAQRRRDLAASLGFPARESVVKILAKIPPEECRLRLLKVLACRLQDHWVRKSLAHIAVIKKEILGVLHSSFYRSVTPSFISGLARLPTETLQELEPDRLLDNAGRVYHRWKCRNLPKHRFQSIEQLRKFVNELERKVTERKLRTLLQIKFPPPPFPGTEAIRAIHTPQLLLEEAGQQHNCLVDYCQQVADGTFYAYRMTSPERGTIGLTKTPSGWELSQVAGPCNKPVAEETEQVLKEWVLTAGGTLNVEPERRCP